MPIQSNTEFSYSLYYRQIAGTFFFQGSYLSVGSLEGSQGVVITNADTFAPLKFLTISSTYAQLHYAYQEGQEATLLSEFILLTSTTDGELKVVRISYPEYNILSTRVLTTDCKSFRAIRVGRVLRIYPISTDELGSMSEIRLDYNAEGQLTKVSNHAVSGSLNSVATTSAIDKSVYLIDNTSGVEYLLMTDPKHKQIN